MGVKDHEDLSNAPWFGVSHCGKEHVHTWPCTVVCRLGEVYVPAAAAASCIRKRRHHILSGSRSVFWFDPVAFRHSGFCVGGSWWWGFGLWCLLHGAMPTYAAMAVGRGKGWSSGSSQGTPERMAAGRLAAQDGSSAHDSSSDSGARRPDVPRFNIADQDSDAGGWSSSPGDDGSSGWLQ